MVKVCAYRGGLKWEVLVLSTRQTRRGDVPNSQLAAKELRSKKFKHNWMAEQEAKGNVVLRVLDDAHTLLAIQVESIVRDMLCTRQSLLKTVTKRFHAFSLARREDLPEAFAALESDGFTMVKPTVPPKCRGWSIITLSEEPAESSSPLEAPEDCKAEDRKAAGRPASSQATDARTAACAVAADPAADCAGGRCSPVAGFSNFRPLDSPESTLAPSPRIADWEFAQQVVLPSITSFWSCSQ
eukprot:m51a1_g4575 hypothetical protein (241) ;mRNA; f:160768-161676